MDFSTLKRFSGSESTVSDCYGYLDCDVVTIEKYIPSRLEASGICLAQDEMPGEGTVILFEKEYYGTLALKIPKELVEATHIFIDGEEYSYAVSGVWDEPRYALLAGPFEAGCKVRLEITGPKRDIIPKEVVTEGVATEEVVTEEVVTEEVIPENDPALIVRELTSDNGTITYKDSFARYLVSMDKEADSVTISFPEKYSLSVHDIKDDCIASVTLPVNESLFTGYSIRICDLQSSVYRDYDIVLMRSYRLADTSACAVHAYTKVTGAFSGEACYIIDYNGSITESATHAGITESKLGIDPVTGYKWGSRGYNSFCFELEPGGYEVIASFSGAGAKMTAFAGTPSEKVLIENSSADAQHSVIRVTEGYLNINVAGPADITLQTLIIRAMDTVAVESGYISLSENDKAVTREFSIDHKDFVHSELPNDKVSYTKTYPAPVKKHVNSSLSAKKSKETAKALGVAAGAVALAGSLIALLTKDRD